MTTLRRFGGAGVVLFLLAVCEFPLVPPVATLEVHAATVPSLSGNPCSITELPSLNLPYYAIEMVKTGRVPGTGRSRGLGQASFARSPFGVSIAPDGSYIYDLTVGFEGLKAQDGHYTVWLTTAEVDNIKRLGVLDANGLVNGRVEWNKYLVVLTLESADDPGATKWSGPIVSRGMSRSGAMHTMAGHGPYVGEPCAKYGFGDNPGRSISNQ